MSMPHSDPKGLKKFLSMENYKANLHNNAIFCIINVRKLTLVQVYQT